MRSCVVVAFTPWPFLTFSFLLEWKILTVRPGAPAEAGAIALCRSHQRSAMKMLLEGLADVCKSHCRNHRLGHAQA